MAQYVESKKMTQGDAVKKGLLNTLLAFQHLIAMFGATILVPIITGLDPSVALFSAGTGTLIFHFCTKGKVPVFLGSSFAFIPVILAVKENYGDLRYAQGGIFVAGLIYVVISLVIKKIGVKKIQAFLPAQVVGPMIIVIGLNLLPTALDMAGMNLMLANESGAITSIIIAAVTLGLALGIKKVSKGYLGQFSIIIAVAVGYILSMILGQVDGNVIKEAGVLVVPNFTLPKFDIGAIMIIVPVILAVFMEHVGDITTNGIIVGENFIEDPGLNRTLLGDGIATAFAALVGGPANTTYGENTSVLAITKNYNPAILRLTAVLAIGLSFVDKFGAVIKTIPTPVMGGISVLLFSTISYIGVQSIKNEKVEMNFKNILVMIVILFIGLSGLFLTEAIGIKLTETVSISGLSLSAIVGVILNLILTKVFK